MKSKGIKKGDLVLRYNRNLDKTFQKKFQVKWEGPFRVAESFANGTYQLENLDGTLNESRVNGMRLKIYHERLMIVEMEMQEDELKDLKSDATVDAVSLTRLFAAVDHE